MKRNTNQGHSFRPERRSNSGTSKTQKRIYPQFIGIALHKGPHADEILARMMLQTNIGRIVFPNIDIDNILWVTDNTHRYNDYPKYLHIGCGKDPRFDEHALKNNFLDSACTLLARELSLINDPAWKETIEDVRREDLHARTKNGEIPWMIKSLYRSHGGTVEADMEIIQWAEMAYWAEIQEARNRQIINKKPLSTKTARILFEKQNLPKVDVNWFFRLARETRKFETDSKNQALDVFLNHPIDLHIFKHESHGNLRIVVVESDNEGFTQVCWKMGTDIFIIRKKNGQTAIQTNRELNLDMTDVWRELIKKEPRGELLWVLAGEKGMILNGSPHFPNVLPSQLKLKTIVEIVQKVLGHHVVSLLSTSYSKLEEELEELCVKS